MFIGITGNFLWGKLKAWAGGVRSGAREFNRASPLEAGSRGVYVSARFVAVAIGRSAWLPAFRVGRLGGRKRSFSGQDAGCAGGGRRPAIVAPDGAGDVDRWWRR